MLELDLTKQKNLIGIGKHELALYWHLVFPGLKFMEDNKRLTDGCGPLHIHHALYNGNATCLFTSIARKKRRTKINEFGAKAFYESREDAIADSCGFCIVQLRDLALGRTCHIWVAVSNKTTNKKEAPPILQTFKDEIWQLARENNCTRVTFSSNQEFWNVHAPIHGFSVQETTYEAEVK
jgi:hypothetical protein